MPDAVPSQLPALPDAPPVKEHVRFLLPLHVVSLAVAFTMPTILTLGSQLPDDKDGRTIVILTLLTAAQLLLFVLAWLTLERRFQTMQKEGGAKHGSDWEAVQRAKHEFLTMADHHLGTPLSGLRWNVELLQQEKLNAGQRGYLKGILTSCERIESTIRALHDAAMIEMRSFFVERQDVAIKQVVDATLLEKERLISQRKAKIQLTVDPAITVRTDPKLLLLLVQHLITSALQYAEEGGTVAVGAGKRAEGTVLSVLTGGAGIPAEKLGQLFQKPLPFRSARYDTESYEGIGLYIIKSIADRLGWQAWFESDANKGVTFHVLIPDDKS